MNLLALAVPLSCLALLSSLALIGVMTLGGVIHLVGAVRALRRLVASDDVRDVPRWGGAKD